MQHRIGAVLTLSVSIQMEVITAPAMKGFGQQHPTSQQKQDSVRVRERIMG